MDVLSLGTPLLLYLQAHLGELYPLEFVGAVSCPEQRVLPGCVHSAVYSGESRRGGGVARSHLRLGLGDGHFALELGLAEGCGWGVG